MTSTNRQRTLTVTKDQQRVFLPISLGRLLLTGLFFVSLLLVYGSIHPSSQRAVMHQFITLAPVLKSSSVFFLALAVGSLTGLLVLPPATDNSHDKTE